MTLRELLIERICFAVDSPTLERHFQVHESELDTLSDLDLLELYEDVVLETQSE